VKIAIMTDVEISRVVAVEQHLAAIGALVPEVIGNLRLFRNESPDFRAD
jgi:hypothetical protein